MVGILVHGNNHFILSGPLPDEATAMALVRYWSIIQIGEAKSSAFGQWEIRSKLVASRWVVWIRFRLPLLAEVPVVCLPSIFEMTHATSAVNFPVTGS